MASTPTQAPAAGGGASSGSGQSDLDLFSDSSSTTKTEDMAKKPLSKDSILSLYGTNSMSQQAPTGEEPNMQKLCWGHTVSDYSNASLSNGDAEPCGCGELNSSR